MFPLEFKELLEKRLMRSVEHSVMSNNPEKNNPEKKIQKKKPRKKKSRKKKI